MANLSIRSRLVLVFSALIAIVIIISTAGIMLLSNANERFELLVNGINARLYAAERIREGVEQRAIAARNLVLVTRFEDLNQEKRAVDQAHADVSEALARLKQLAEGADALPEERRLIDARGDREALCTGRPGHHGPQPSRGNTKRPSRTAWNNECRPLLARLIKASKDYAVRPASFQYPAERGPQLLRGPAQRTDRRRPAGAGAVGHGGP